MSQYPCPGCRLQPGWLIDVCAPSLATEVWYRPMRMMAFSIVICAPAGHAQPRNRRAAAAVRPPRRHHCDFDIVDQFVKLVQLCCHQSSLSSWCFVPCAWCLVGAWYLVLERNLPSLILPNGEPAESSGQVPALQRGRGLSRWSRGLMRILRTPGFGSGTRGFRRLADIRSDSGESGRSTTEQRTYTGHTGILR